MKKKGLLLPKVPASLVKASTTSPLKKLTAFCERTLGGVVGITCIGTRILSLEEFVSLVLKNLSFVFTFNKPTRFLYTCILYILQFFLPLRFIARGTRYNYELINVRLLPNILSEKCSF